MRFALYLSCGWLAIAASEAIAQPAAQPPTATPIQIRGQVVAALNGAALGRVRVAAAAGAAAIEPVLTDAQGRFVVTLPGPGYSLTMTKAGYAALTLPAGAPELRARTELQARLAPGAVVTGRVLDPLGLPVPLVPVQARRVATNDGNAAIDFRTETDDLGEFRLGGLPEGRYTVTAGPLPRVRPGSGFDFVKLIGNDGIVTSTVVDVPPGAPTISLENAARPGLALPPGHASLTVATIAGEETAGTDFVLEPRGERIDLSMQNGGATIRGRVLGDAGQPLAGAAVSLQTGPGFGGSLRIVGDDGTYTFENVLPGEYRVYAARLGYVALEHGQRAPAEHVSPLAVTAESLLDGIDIMLPRGSAIAGMVVDDNGEPIEGVPVGAWALRTSSGRTIAAAAGRTRQTDDRGHFRLFGFPPGDYIVGATIDATIYAPGSDEIEQAQGVRLEIGESVAGVEVRFTPRRTASISGTALRSSGQPVKGNVQLLRSRRSGRIAPEPRSVALDADGSFRFGHVARGEYVVQVLADPGPGTVTEFAAEYVDATDADPPPLAIRTAPPATLNGRLVRDASPSAGSSGSSPSFRLIPADPDRSPPAGTASMAVHSDGSFYITRLWGPGRLVLTSAPDDAYLRSISAGGVDFTDGEFDFGFSGATFEDAEIVLSQDGATVAGRATAEQPEAAAGYSVVVFAADPRDRITHSQYIKYGRSLPDGSFRISGLAPGSYFAAAVDRLDLPAATAEWDPAALDRLAARAPRVTLRERETRTLTLRIITQ